MSDTARMLDDTVERLLARHFAGSQRGTPDSAAAVLSEFFETGLDQLLVPEALGGMGGGTLEAAAVAYRWGYHAAPGPIVEMLLLPALTASAGLEPEGSTLVSCEGAGVQSGTWRPPAKEIAVVAPVIGERASSVLVGTSDERGHLALARVGTGAAETRRSLAGEEVVLLDLASAQPISIHATETSFETFAARGALLTACAIIGAAQRQLEITIEHANTRKQFGKPLGKFQAIQHRLAEAASEQAVAQASVRSAMAAQDAGRLKPLQWQAAKIQAGRAATTVAAAAHQILGAIAFTEEHVLHHYSKRLWTWRDAWGSEADLELRLGAQACSQGAGLWPWMVD
jgi:acyl-CoA dehydrogenase